MAEPTIEELAASVAAKDNELDALKKQVEGLEKLRGGWGNEVGDAKKRMEEFVGKIEGLEATIKTLTEDRDAVKKELDALKDPEKNGGGKKPAASVLPDKDTNDELEKSLTDDQKALVEKMLEDEADAEKFMSDEAYRRTVLEAVTAADGKKVSLWRVKKAAPSSDDVADHVKKLLKKAKGENVDEDERGGGGGQRKTPQRKEREPVTSWT